MIRAGLPRFFCWGGTKIENDFIMPCFFGAFGEERYIPREKPLDGSTE